MTANTNKQRPNNSKRYSALRWVAAVVVLFTITVTLMVFWAVRKQERIAFEHQIAEHALLLGRQIDGIFQERVNAIDRMGARWEHIGGTSRKLFDLDAQNYLSTIPGLQAIEYAAPDGRIQWVNPMQGNEKALGFQLTSEPVRRAAVEHAKNTRQITLSGLVDFVQGGNGLLIIRALYVDGKHDGYIIAVFRFNEVMQKLNAEELLNGYLLTLAHGPQPQNANGSETLTKLMPLKLGDGQWWIRLIVDPRSATLNRSTISDLVLLAGLSVAVLLALIFGFWLKIMREQSRTYEMESRWRFAVEGSEIGLWDWDAVSNKVYYSSSWKSMLGYSDADIGDTLDEWDKRIHPDDRESTYAELHRHFRGETDIYISDHRMLCKNGEYLWIHDRGKVMAWTPDGKPARVMGTHLNIHEQTLLKQALDEEQRYLRNIMDNAPMGIWHQDSNGRLVFVNRWFCNAVGIPEERFLSVDHYSELYEPEMAERCIASDMAAMAADTPQVSYETIPFTDGQNHDLEITKIRLDEESGQQGIIGIAQDISERKKLDSVLKLQEQRIRDILHNQNVATFIIDTQHRVQFWNRACETLTGVEAHQIIGTTDTWRGFYTQKRPCLADLVLDSRQADIGDYYEYQQPSTLLETGWHAEGWFENLGGRRRYVIFDAAPIHDHDGNLVSVVETLQDITEQKHVEESLRETEGRFHEIADSAPVMIWMAGTDRIVSFFNRTFLDFIGKSLENSLHGGWVEAVYPEDRANYRSIYDRNFDVRNSFSTEVRIRRYDGEYRWVYILGVPRFTDHGDFVGYIGTGIDIEENKRNQHEILEGRATAQRALKALEYQKFALDEHAIVATTDANGHITYANRKFCEISGYTLEELLDQDHRIVNSGHHPKSFFNHLYQTIQQGKTWHGEICNRAKNGQLYWVDTTIVPFLGENGAPERYIAIRTDITERKRAESELIRHRDHLQDLVKEQTADLRAAKEAAERADLAKSEFLANMSHELRTPMHAILSFSDLGLEKIDSATPEKLGSYFKRIHTSGERLLLLLNDLLDLSKLEAGQMVLEIHPHDLRPLVRDAIAEFESLITNKRLHLTVEESNCNTTALVDANRFGQVIRNLLSNAIKFTPDEGSITLRFSSAETRHGRRAEDGGQFDPAVMLEIIDAGIGIPENELDSIFDKFVQSSKTKTNAGGTGLGLSICKEMVEAHRGRIYAHNNPEGGATFTVILPTRDFTPPTPYGEAI